MTFILNLMLVFSISDTGSDASAMTKLICCGLVCFFPCAVHTTYFYKPKII